MVRRYTTDNNRSVAVKAYFVRRSLSNETGLSLATWPLCRFMLGGLAVRHEGEYRTTIGILGLEGLCPLHIIRNTYRMPQIWNSRHGHLIISEDLKRQLDGMPNIEYQQVVFDKLFNVPWQDGDEALIDMFHPKDDTYEMFCKSAPPVDGPPEDVVGKHYEVILAFYDPDMAEQPFPRGKIHAASDIKEGFFEEDVAPFSIALSEQLFEQYPLFYHAEGCYVMNERVHAILSPHLSSTYYRTAVAEF